MTASRHAQANPAEEKISREVAALHPQKNAQSANDQLAKRTHDIAAAIDEVIPKVRSAASPAAAILNKSSAGAKAGQELDQALTELRKLGYTTGS